MFNGIYNRTIDCAGQNRPNAGITASPFARFTPRNCCATQGRKFSHSFFPCLSDVFIMRIRNVLGGLHGMQPLTLPSFETKNQPFLSMTHALFANRMAAPVPTSNPTSLIDCAKQLIGSIANSSFVSAHDHCSDQKQRFPNPTFEVDQHLKKTTPYGLSYSTAKRGCGQRSQQFTEKYTNRSKFGQSSFQMDAVGALLNTKKEELSDGLMDAVASTGKYLSSTWFYFVFENTPPMDQPKVATNTPASPTVQNQEFLSATMLPVMSRQSFTAGQAPCAFSASSSSFAAACSDTNNNNKTKNISNSNSSHDSNILPASCRQLVAECVKLTPTTELCAQVVPKTRQRNFSECSDDFICFLNDEDDSDEHCDGQDTIDFDVDDESSDSDCFDSADIGSNYSLDGDSDEDDILTSYQFDAARDCRAKKPNIKKVRFDPQPKVHVMRTWNFAYRSARKGQWEDYARDRARFQLRIKRSEAYLDHVLSAEHRSKIYQCRFAEHNET